MSVEHVTIRRARTSDVIHIRRLVDEFSGEGRVLSKSTVNLYEDIQEFRVAEADNGAQRIVVGCGRLRPRSMSLIVRSLSWARLASSSWVKPRRRRWRCSSSANFLACSDTGRRLVEVWVIVWLV